MRKRLEDMSQTYRDAMQSLSPWFVGFDSLLEDVANIAHNTTGYPPYNIIREENHTTIEVALAGLSASDVEVYTEKNALHVKYQKPQIQNSDDPEMKKQYAHRGIANRSFDLTLSIAEGVFVENAGMKDGLLILTLKKQEPEKTRTTITVSSV